jgi:hypothetical protein
MDGNAEVTELLDLDLSRIAIRHDGTGHWQVAKDLHITWCRIRSVLAPSLLVKDGIQERVPRRPFVWPLVGLMRTLHRRQLIIAMV